MSLRFRRAFAYWFLMLIGVAIIVIQLVRYYNNVKFETFDYTAFAVAILLLLAPGKLVKLVEGLFNKKSNENNG